jgi:hypothetical protein
VSMSRVVHFVTDAHGQSYTYIMLRIPCMQCALCQEHREVKLRMEVENEGTYIIPPVIEEMEKPASMAPAVSTGIKEGAGGVYYTLLAKA